MILNKRGYTLIEVIIVVMVIFILAAIIARMSGEMRNRAIAQEAVAGLFALRIAVKDYYYSHETTYEALNDLITDKYPESVKPGDLNGVYFQDKCYKVVSSSGYIYCYPSESNNELTKRMSVHGGTQDYIRMNRDTGDIKQSGLRGSGFKEA